MDIIENKIFGAERALYAISNTELKNCIFDGEEDGESALKEARNISAEDCRFLLRYPLWHTDKFVLSSCFMADTARAAIWYCTNGTIDNLTTQGIKGLRECRNIYVKNSKIVSPEFGWKCDTLCFDKCDVTSEYFLLDSKNITMKELTLNGKYSFQYNENLTLQNCVLNTKDAFWHAKNVTVTDSVITGEYLAWYSENVTFINCKIKGTQPFCYCKGLKLINCTMTDCDLAFEYSDVQADINGNITSVKNPRSGYIIADSYGKIINADSVTECNCTVETR